MKKGNKVSISAEYLKNIEKKVADLQKLMEVSAVITSTLNFKELMTVVMEKAKDIMNAEACSILLHNKKTDKLEFEVVMCSEEKTGDILKKNITLGMGEGIAGWVAENGKPLIIKDVNEDLRFSKEADIRTGFKTGSLIAVPLVGRRGLIGVAEILNPLKKAFFETYDLEIFQALCHQIGIALENSLFHKESVEREKLRQELELASTLQRSFLPESPLYKKNNITAEACNIPARHVGGDLYDFVDTEDGEAGFFIGDISGKGVSAALYMSKMISDFRYLAYQSKSPEIVLNNLNEILSRAPRGIFLTAVYMIADTKSGKIRLSVAGHPPFFWITRGEVKVMDVQAGPPLGIVPFDYSVSEISLEKGDRLLLLTDGFFDARDKKGNRIGFDSMVMLVRDHMYDDELVRMITDYVHLFSEGAEQSDDLTLIEIKFHG